MSEFNKKYILFAAILTVILIIIVGIFIIKNKLDENSEVKSYTCYLTIDTEKYQYNSSYSFYVINNKLDKVVNVLKYVYNDHELYNDIINDDNRKIKCETEGCFKYDNESYTIIYTLDKVLNEEAIDYNNKDWLDNYIKKIEEKYACNLK